MPNLYTPRLTKVVDVVAENDLNDIKTIELKFVKDQEIIEYIPGQFAEISIIGKGECPIGIASSPTEGNTIKFTIKKMGTVTSGFHTLEVGDTVGIRGPCGNSWPLEGMKGKNIVVIGGGFAFSTLRSLLLWILDKKNRKNYKDVTVIYGNRNSGEVLYRPLLEEWEKRDDINLVLTIDGAEEGWTREVGFVAAIVKKVAPKPNNAVAVICGPPIMIRTAVAELVQLGWKDEQILNSLEMRMKCGVGKCGRCNIGNKYVCVDGPVFSLAELKKMPNEY
jgi:sulfhydrogenase subunit gamma (sulfur reductase)